VRAASSAAILFAASGTARSTSGVNCSPKACGSLTAITYIRSYCGSGKDSWRANSSAKCRLTPWLSQRNPRSAPPVAAGAPDRAKAHRRCSR